MNSRLRFPGIFKALIALLIAVLALAGCESMRGKKEKPPVLNVPLDLALPGTMVVYMPKIVSAAKQQGGDPVYMNWATALMDYVDESTFVQSIVDQGRRLDSKTRISSKTIPSSDYSILLVGTKARAVHVQEPWQSVELFLLLDPYLRGEGSTKNLPPGCEAVTIAVRVENEETPDADAEKKEKTPVEKPAAEPKKKAAGTEPS